MAVDLKPHVDAVPRGAGDGARDHTLLLGQRVDERALADIAPPHDRQLHLRQVRPLGLLFRPRLGQVRDDRLDELVAVAVLPHADDHGRTEAERIELVSMHVEFRVVRLVGHEQHITARLAQPRRHLAIGGQESAAHLDDEDDERRIDQPRLDLPIDLSGESVGIVEPHAAGVDEIEHAAVEIDPLHESVAGHARGRILDRDPLADDPIEEARLTDVRPADDDDFWNHISHEMLLENACCITAW